MPLRHEPDVSHADWFATRDEPWVQLCCLGPSGFERYARLFAPGTEHEQPEQLEGDLDDITLARLCAVLARHTGTPADCFFALWEGYGDLHDAVGTTTAFDDGTGQARTTSWTRPPVLPRDVLDGPRVRIPNRAYLLFRGPLEAAGDWGARPRWPGEHNRVNSPNLMWPADHAWFVATEVDQPWTGVAGTADLMADLAVEGLDLDEVTWGQQPPYWR
jgi:hypothetical protein